MTKGRVLAAVAAAITLVFAIQSRALAQYPPPQGSLICSYAQVNIQLGASIRIKATLIDIYGQVMVGETVNFSVAGGGSISTTSAVTDGSGTASVNVSVDGSTSTVIVYAQNDGLQCQAVIQVLRPRVEVLSVISPPKTGNAGLAAQSPVTEAPMTTYLAVVGAGALGLTLVSGAWTISKRR